MNEVVRSFQKSLKRLEEALGGSRSVLIRDATILRFAFTFELAWKALQQYLRTEQIVCQTPKSCMSEAFTVGLIPDDSRWNKMIEDRNLVVHTYAEELAKDVLGRIPSYLPLLQGLLAELKKRSK